MGGLAFRAAVLFHPPLTSPGAGSNWGLSCCLVLVENMENLRDREFQGQGATSLRPVICAELSSQAGGQRQHGFKNSGVGN